MRNGLGEVYSTATQHLLMRTSEGEVEVVHRDGNRNPHRTQINFIKFEIHAGILIWMTNILLGARTTTTTTTTPMRYLNFHQELSRRSS